VALAGVSVTEAAAATQLLQEQLLEAVMPAITLGLDGVVVLGMVALLP
jgi:hypothetical protein